MIYVLLFGAGILGGFLSGLLGIGGGIIFIFVLGEAFYQLGVPEEVIHQYVIANSFFAILFSSLAANITLIRIKEFYLKYVLLVGGASIVCALLIQQFFVNTANYRKGAFDIFVIVLLVLMLIKTLMKNLSNKADQPLQQVSSIKYILGGMAGGIVATLSGLGGGVIMVPLLNAVFQLNYKTARSISLGVIFLTALSVTVRNMTYPTTMPHSIGYVSYAITPAVIAGVLISAPLGIYMSRKMKASTISYIYSFFLILFIVKKSIELL